MTIATDALTGHLALETRARVQRRANFAAVLRPKLSVWADTYRKLPSESSAVSGQWVSFPFQQEIMDVLGSGQFRRVIAMLPSQVCGKTEIALNLILSHIHLSPCPMLFVTYSLDMARRLSKKRIAPAFREMGVLKGKLLEHGARKEADDTILYKQGPGWSLGMVGANSPGGLAMDAIRILAIDEVDRFPPSAGEEGDVISIAEKRTTSYSTNRIVYLSSTPGLEETSRIDREYKKSDQRTWRVPCPHCNFTQSLEWGGPDEKYGLKWEKDSDGKPVKESVMYLCAGCGVLIEEKWKHQMNDAGVTKPVEGCGWVASHGGRDIAGFQCTALVSPILTWGEMAVEWYDAKDNPEETKTFVNTRLCRTYSSPGARADTEGLKARRATFPEDGAGYPIVPLDAGLLTAFVDVQLGGERGPARLEIAVSAWGPGKQEWKLGVFRFLRNSKNPKEAWESIEMIRTRAWRHESGATMHIRMTAVDSGNETAEVCEYVRPLERSGVMATKGSSDSTAQPLTKGQKRSTKYKVLVWSVGTVAIKDEIFNSFQRVTTAGPGYIQFSHQIDDAFIEQLGNERASYKRIGGQTFRFYEQIGDKLTEGIDHSVGVRAALYALGPTTIKQLAQIARGVQERGAVEKAKASVPEPVLSAPEEREPEVTPRVQRQPRRGGFVNRWKQ
jgi:phage terminase large subunit GpA-like protein